MSSQLYHVSKINLNRRRIVAPSVDDVAELEPFREGVFDLDPFGLRGVRCAVGHYTFPVRTFCGTCKSELVEPVPLSGGGVLHTFTVVRQAPPGVAVPYVLGYVDLPEGCRLMARIEHRPGVEPAIGAPVDLVPAIFSEGGASGDRLGFAFCIRTENPDPKERHDA
jgi:uncharacterized protein